MNVKGSKNILKNVKITTLLFILIGIVAISFGIISFFVINNMKILRSYE
ncbi:MULTISPECIES: hypothetical protein [Thermoanaerobacter]|uniref:Uncharacterized protein n=2 Tax=Thermoanaerobacter TaxID=1754 RepID=I8R398_9THEO|nr:MULTISPECIES: hypothetical protein [Thermoanaerobacter]AEM79713.1 hypothetical protein Thewi_2368 [Thermoanaerobacter wiegelii Rt8.B1]EGD51649.1 hypothetical protein TheetDRAFT_1609 [Thermoanaerobacter ethanolicus JW 200]EIV99879.1 hypothetical protein ThesiDRAFT1_0889 [Thermoanaerobacter siderophilus SR4]UZQ82677.1 hypothetical protein OEI98_002592 [Thermoanaerobacter sp. RKWS2]